MEVVARCRDTALRYARRRPMIVVGLGEHHLSPGYRGRPPRSHLERVKRGNPVWVQSGHRGRAGGLTVRNVDLPGGRRMTKKPMPVAETRRETGMC
jgi:hypothetical protein